LIDEVLSPQETSFLHTIYAKQDAVWNTI